MEFFISSTKPDTFHWKSKKTIQLKLNFNTTSSTSTHYSRARPLTKYITNNQKPCKFLLTIIKNIIVSSRFIYKTESSYYNTTHLILLTNALITQFIARKHNNFTKLHAKTKLTNPWKQCNMYRVHTNKQSISVCFIFQSFKLIFCCKLIFLFKLTFCKNCALKR